LVALAAGATFTGTYGPLQGLRIDVPANCTGTITFTPLDVWTAEVIGSLPEEGNSRRFGPIAEKFTFGPMNRYGRYTLVNDPRSAASIDYSSTTVVLGTGVTQGSTTMTGSLTFTTANVSANFSPTGTGTVTINPATFGTINNMNIGQTSMGLGRFNQLQLSYTDNSGTPGNTTFNTGRGRLAIAAGASSVVLTNSQIISANTSVYAIINQASADATLTHIQRVLTAANTATIYGNAAATGNVIVDVMVVA